MSVYARWIFPRLLDLVMRNRVLARYREAVVPPATGTVLEIGAGSGLNFPYYGGPVERVYALDPSPALLDMAARRSRDLGVPATLLPASAESIPLEDASIDTVVTTFTLCSIEDPAKGLAEMRRVLKPGGTLLFAEHGLAPDRDVQGWQHRCNPLWHRLSGGCNLDRKIDALITSAGFTLGRLDTGYAKAPRMLGYMYWGCAVSGPRA